MLLLAAILIVSCVKTNNLNSGNIIRTQDQKKTTKNKVTKASADKKSILTKGMLFGIVLLINEKGVYFISGYDGVFRKLINGQHKTLKKALIWARIRRKEKFSLVIKADDRTPYQAVFAIIDVASQMGFKKMLFMYTPNSTNKINTESYGQNKIKTLMLIYNDELKKEQLNYLDNSLIKRTETSKKVVVLTINSKGTCFISGNNGLPRQLINQQVNTLKKALIHVSSGLEKKPVLRINADAQTSIKAVISAIDIAKLVGFNSILFSGNIIDAHTKVVEGKINIPFKIAIH